MWANYSDCELGSSSDKNTEESRNENEAYLNEAYSSDGKGFL
jgi:hypothetical protein